MSGKKAGIAALFKKLNVLMLYSHCYGHALNLTVKDVICNVEILKETFEIIREIVKLVNGSPQRNTKLSKFREESNNLDKNVHEFVLQDG